MSKLLSIIQAAHTNDILLLEISLKIQYVQKYKHKNNKNVKIKLKVIKQSLCQYIQNKLENGIYTCEFLPTGQVNLKNNMLADVCVIQCLKKASRRTRSNYYRTGKKDWEKALNDKAKGNLAKWFEKPLVSIVPDICCGGKTPIQGRLQ